MDGSEDPSYPSLSWKTMMIKIVEANSNYNRTNFLIEFDSKSQYLLMKQCIHPLCYPIVIS